MLQHRFYLKLTFQRATQTSLLVVLHQEGEQQQQQQQMELLLTSAGDGLHVLHGSAGFDTYRNMYYLPTTGQVVTHPETTALERAGVLDANAFLDGICLLSSFVYKPAASQLQRQLAAV